MEDLGPAIQAEGLAFVPLRNDRFLPGALKQLTAKLAGLKGMGSLKFAIECECLIANLILECAPRAVQSAGIDVLLVDQNEPAGATVAGI